jgi:hypothetical protein
MDELELARRLVLANRRGRFRWQAGASGPGTSGVSVVAPNGCAPDLLDRLEADPPARPRHPGDAAAAPHTSTNAFAPAGAMALEPLGPITRVVGPAIRSAP